LERLALHIESLIFSTENTIGLNQIKTCIEETLEQSYKNVDIKKAIDSLIEKYRSDDFSFEIVEIASGYKFLTKGSYHKTVGTLIKKNNQKRLSKAALETLSIIAYKQPVTKSDVEGIRGVNCDYTIQKLLEKDLVAINGRAEGPGRPLLYGTSEKFMDYFGIKDISSLPKLQELKVPDIQIGEPAPIEEDRIALATEGNIQDSDIDENLAGNDEVANDDISESGNDKLANDDMMEEKVMSTDINADDIQIGEQDQADKAMDNEEFIEDETMVRHISLDQHALDEEIQGEQPKSEEEAHQALLNQEIVSSVDSEESVKEASEIINTTIISDEEE